MSDTPKKPSQSLDEYARDLTKNRRSRSIQQPSLFPGLPPRYPRTRADVEASRQQKNLRDRERRLRQRQGLERIDALSPDERERILHSHTEVLRSPANENTSPAFFPEIEEGGVDDNSIFLQGIDYLRSLPPDQPVIVKARGRFRPEVLQLYKHLNEYGWVAIDETHFARDAIRRWGLSTLKASAFFEPGTSLLVVQTVQGRQDRKGE